jgi:hypothetical protein
MRWLTTDWDHRDPDHDLEDVETGKCLDAIDGVGGLTRMLLESTDFHAQVEDEDGHYRITKLIRKRNPEFQQGKEVYFVYDDEGRRISLSEDQMDHVLGLTHNPEDVFEADVTLEGIESEHIAPMDAWDVVWDETDVYRAEKRLEKAPFWDSFSEEQQEQEFQMLRDGIHPEYPDTREYSANFFEYPQDKRCTSVKAKLIAKQITETNVSRGRLAQLLSEPPKRDLRPEKARKLKEQAAHLPPGKDKLRLMNQANAMMSCYARSLRAMRRKGKRFADEQPVSASDKRTLWALWREQELVKHGKVELTQWQYERALYAKLVRSGVDHSEARTRVRKAVKKLYNSDKIGRLVPYGPGTLPEEKKPEWLQGVQPDELEQNDEDWEQSDWLPQGDHLGSACRTIRTIKDNRENAL